MARIERHGPKRFHQFSGKDRKIETLFSSVGILTEDKMEEIQARITSQKYVPGAAQIGWFAIPQGMTRPKFIKHFEEQMKILETNIPGLFKQEHGGRGGPGDALRQLAAYRVLQDRTLPEAKVFIREETAQLKDKTDRGYPYGDDGSWMTAKEQVKDRLKPLDDFASEWLRIFNKSASVEPEISHLG